MASTSSPYGLTPINLLGGQSFAGSTRLYAIPSGFATAIQSGDPVVFTTSGSNRGTITRFNTTTAATTVTASATIVGVFVGVTFTDPVMGPTFRQNYTGGITASDIQAYVVDDPDALFQVQANGTLGQVALGTNASLIQTNAGSTGVNIVSGVSLQASSVAATAGLPLRIVDFVLGPNSAVGDAFTDVIVRINTHFHRQTTGVAAS